LSEVVIKQMNVKNKHRDKMHFIKMDMLNMDFDDGDFEVVLDKGTLDALMSDTSEKVFEEADRMFAEIDRVLKTSGRYICISLAQDHILSKLLTSYTA
jgi:ubiquinone/menaquinone biosynthesis C-methylase UbiE